MRVCIMKSWDLRKMETQLGFETNGTKHRFGLESLLKYRQI